MTLSIAVCLHSPQIVVYLLCIETFILPNKTLDVSVHLLALIPESVRYVLGHAQHDPQRNRPSSQPVDRSLSTVYQDFSP